MYHNEYSTDLHCTPPLLFHNKFFYPFPRALFLQLAHMGMMEIAATEVQVSTTATKKNSAELDIGAMNPDADGDGQVSPLEMEVMRMPTLPAAHVPSVA